MACPAARQATARWPLSDVNPIQEAFDELMAKCTERELPFMLTLFDGEHETCATAVHGSGTVMLLDAVPEKGATSLVGRVVIQLDAKMLLRLLPRLVLETHRALALVPEDDE